MTSKSPPAAGRLPKNRIVVSRELRLGRRGEATRVRGKGLGLAQRLYSCAMSVDILAVLGSIGLYVHQFTSSVSLGRPSGFASEP